MIKNIKLKNSVIAYDPGELIDKLTILQIKEIKLPKSKANFNEGIKKIIKDINKYLNGNIDIKLINYVIILSQINLYIWNLREQIYKESKMDKKKLNLVTIKSKKKKKKKY